MHKRLYDHIYKDFNGSNLPGKRLVAQQRVEDWNRGFMAVQGVELELSELSSPNVVKEGDNSISAPCI